MIQLRYGKVTRKDWYAIDELGRNRWHAGTLKELKAQIESANSNGLIFVLAHRYDYL